VSVAPSGSIQLRSIGHVASPLRERAAAPKQGDEGAPEATLLSDADVAAGLADLRLCDEALLLTWLYRAGGDVLEVHPRGDRSHPLEALNGTPIVDLEPVLGEER
jgi:tRNA (Thr-GGU) A37 N-methylase